MKLEYITRGMSDVRGKPRVYLTCHPEDRERAIPLISEDLLRHANCAVWHDAEMNAPYDPQELGACLDEMQLMVLAVTSKFLYTACRARDVALKYALRQHIPVLPILLESGLSREFNRVTDTKLQVVNRCVSDSTATPYDEVLDTYLKSVLVGDELAERVRDAFDAYVFLSYRKKDRRHAQRLMHLIHENRQFRDIAIWYDEFLVPGERYDEAIRAAFEKSSLFALAVTPNLLEPKNYVLREEYPMARNRRQKKGDLEIVPVELYETERGDARIERLKMETVYRDIPPIQDEHQPRELNAALLEALRRISKKENDGSARHRFFIGLAYLCGIDVEVDRDRAIALLESAATDPEPCFDATEKLVDMYINGDGVARDMDRAVGWQKTLCDQYRAEYEKGRSPDEHLGFGTRYFRALMGLSDLLREAGKLSDAVASAEQALTVAGTLTDEVGAREVQRDTAVICNRLGGLFRARGERDRAEEYYRRALDINARLAREMGTARARRDLSVSQERLGDVYRHRKDLDRAEALYREALSLREALAEADDSPRARRDLSAIRTKLGNIKRSRMDYDGAAADFRAALALDKVLSEELRTWQARDDCAVSLVKLGEVQRARGACREAAALQQEAVAIFEKNAAETGSAQYRKNLAAGLEKLAKSLDGLDRRDEAISCLERAVALREALLTEFPSHTASHELATTLCLFAEYTRDAGMMERALRLWEEICRNHPEYERYADRARRALEKLTGRD